MVMKRIEAGEDVFAEFQKSLSPTGQQANLIHGFSTVPYSGIDSLKMYDSLSPCDRGAVIILFEMAR